MSRLRIVILGLSITSSWGNGHATTYRGLVRGLSRLGHEVIFLERDVPWYAAHRDLQPTSQVRACLYADLQDLARRFAVVVEQADVVIVGSYVPQGPKVLRWVLDVARGAVAFYDIDTPITVAKLAAGDEEYIAPELLPFLDVYLSFTGGPLLEQIRRDYGIRRTAPLYCSVDPEAHAPTQMPLAWDLGYLGTYSDDRQPKVERLLNAPARWMPERRFVVAGPQYPAEIAWSANVERIDHLPPERHPAFYSAQRFTLNITRAEMVAAGWSPSVRLFEAAACGAPIITDAWAGLDAFFEPDREILIAEHEEEVAAFLIDICEERRREIAAAARRRVLSSHTAAHRARELEACLLELHATTAA